MLLMLMMLPSPRSAIPGAKAPTSRNAARTFAANIASNVSTWKSAVGAQAENPPLLTRTSTSPTRAARRVTSSASPRSAASNRALPPTVYQYEPKTFEGLVLPTQRRVHRRSPGGIADQSQTSITIDVADIAFDFAEQPSSIDQAHREGSYT